MKGFIQVGLNIANRVVKMRVPDEKSPDGFLVVRFSPDEALALADEIEKLPGRDARSSE